MANYDVKRIDEMEAIYGGAFKRARAEVGVESFGMAIIDFPPNSGDAYPEHDHSGDRQEEVYAVMSGSGEIEIDGERVPLDADTVVRVGPGTKRRIRTKDLPMRVLAIGGVAGEPYTASELSKLGAPEMAPPPSSS